MNFTTAASGLRWLPPFHDVSLRLLQDLIEFASQEQRQSPAYAPKKGAATTSGDIWQVLRGVLEVSRDRGRVPRRIGPGRYYVARPGDGRVRPAAGHEGTLRVRRFDKEWLKDAMKVSFTLARTVSRSATRELLSFTVPPKVPPAHRILLTRAARFCAPVEALAHLLAAGIASQFQERAAVVVLEPAALSLSIWRDGRFVVPEPLKVDGSGTTEQRVLEAVGKAVGKAEGLHLVFVHPADPLRLPAWWRDEFFHRIVYVTDQWEFGETAPQELLDLLYRDLWDADRPLEGPFFSSFIPTLILPPARPSRWPRLPVPLGPGLRSLKVIPIADDADFTTHPEPIHGKWRLYRDLCRVRLDLPALSERWDNPARGRAGFAATELRAAASSIERWARAVTNRQVGVALSGGGAVNALLIPLLQRIAARVPIDVLSGVSGGTVLGAFLCTDNPGGLALYRRQGLVFQLGLMGAVLDSGFIERTLDWLLDGARVEQLETRLVGVTTEVRDDSPPGARAVVKGTVGEAARVSGAAPGLFGPAAKGSSRFLDGATTLAVPARILPDFGADIAFAFNAVGPLKEGNLLRALACGALGKAVADVCYHLPLLGRNVDSAVGQLTLLEQASRADVDDVDVFYEVPPEAIPVLRGFEWLRVDNLARAVEANENSWSPVCDRCVTRWEEFSRAPGDP